MTLCHVPAVPVVNYEIEESRQCFRPCIVPGTTRKHADRPITALQWNGRPSGLSYWHHSYQRQAFEKPGDSPGRGLPIRPHDALPN
jgi:hypothetical protein